jgi:hypothetical protein
VLVPAPEEEGFGGARGKVASPWDLMTPAAKLPFFLFLRTRLGRE